MTTELAIAFLISCVITAGISLVRKHFDEMLVLLGFAFVNGFYLWLHLF